MQRGCLEDDRCCLARKRVWALAASDGGLWRSCQSRARHGAERVGWSHRCERSRAVAVIRGRRMVCGYSTRAMAGGGEAVEGVRCACGAVRNAHKFERTCVCVYVCGSASAYARWRGAGLRLRGRARVGDVGPMGDVAGRGCGRSTRPGAGSEAVLEAWSAAWLESSGRAWCKTAGVCPTVHAARGRRGSARLGSRCLASRGAGCGGVGSAVAAVGTGRPDARLT